MTEDTFLRGWGLALRDLCEQMGQSDATLTVGDLELVYVVGEGLQVDGELLSDAWLDDVGLVPA